MKITLKKFLIEVLDFLINKVNSHPKLKSKLHPIVIKTPIINKILYLRKSKISNSSNKIGPLLLCPKSFEELTESGQSYFINLKIYLKI